MQENKYCPIKALFEEKRKEFDKKYSNKMDNVHLSSPADPEKINGTFIPPRPKNY